eukprot:COSAG01_NODE_17897_length_1116_cov_1.053097_2_plen_107_part_00
MWAALRQATLLIYEERPTPQRQQQEGQEDAALADWIRIGASTEVRRCTASSHAFVVAAGGRQWTFSVGLEGEVGDWICGLRTLVKELALHEETRVRAYEVLTTANN